MPTLLEQVEEYYRFFQEGGLGVQLTARDHLIKRDAAAASVVVEATFEELVAVVAGGLSDIDYDEIAPYARRHLEEAIKDLAIAILRSQVKGLAVVLEEGWVTCHARHRCGF